MRYIKRILVEEYLQGTSNYIKTKKGIKSE